MTKRFFYVVAAVATLTACGGSDNLCDKAVSVGSNLNSKLAPCGQSISGLPTNTTACNASLPQCSSNDQTILNNFLDCANSLPACTDSTFDAKATSCAAPMTGLSSACQAAFSITP